MTPEIDGFVTSTRACARTLFRVRSDLRVSTRRGVTADSRTKGRGAQGGCCARRGKGGRARSALSGVRAARRRHLCARRKCREGPPPPLLVSPTSCGGTTFFHRCEDGQLSLARSAAILSDSRVTASHRRSCGPGCMRTMWEGDTYRNAWPPGRRRLSEISH